MADEWPNDPPAQAWPADPPVGPTPQALAVSGAQANPEQTAKVIDLSSRMKIPASVVEPDIEGATVQHRTKTALQSIESNPQLAAWVAMNAQHGRIVGDDWANLDKVSRSATNLADSNILSHFYTGDNAPSFAKNYSIIQNNQIVNEGMRPGTVHSITKIAENPLGDWSKAQQRELASWMAADSTSLLSIKGVSVAKFALGFIPMLALGLIEAAPNFIQMGLNDVPGRPFADMSETEQDQYVKKALAAGQFGIDAIRFGKVAEGLSTPAELEAFHALLRGKSTREEIDAFIKAKDLKDIPPDLNPQERLLLTHGAMPPEGTGFVTDQIHVQQNKVDAVKLDRVMQDAENSALRERSPAAFAELLLLHHDGDLYLPAQTVADIYTKAGKLPETGDGLFGYVRGLGAQIRAGLDTGTEIKIAVADFVAHTDSTVYEQVKDQIRHRAEGVTKEEAKELAEKKPEDYEQETIRSAAIKVGDKIYEGIHHGEAVLKAEKELGKELDSSIESDLAGFITSKGRYVNREEALKIAQEADQGISRDVEDTKLISEHIIPPDQQIAKAIKKSLYLNPLFAEAKAAGLMTETELKQYSAKIEAAQDKEARKITRGLDKELEGQPQALIDNAIELALANDYADIMAQETRVLARAGGFAPHYTYDQIKSFVKDNFAQQKMKDVGDWERLRRAVFTQGREAEKALLKGKFEEAFQAKNRQLMSFLGMKELDAFQKKMDSVDKKIERIVSEPSIKSMDQAHLEQAQNILGSLGYPRNFGPHEIVPLKEFVSQSEGQLAVASWLTEGERPTFGEMTTQQFIELGKSLDSIMHVGREVKKVENVHGKADFDNVVFDAVQELDRFKMIEQPYHPTFRQKTGGLGRMLTAPTMLVERMFDYTDKFNPRGPTTAYIDRPLRDSFSNELKLTEGVVSKFRKLQEFIDPSINDSIPNAVLPNRSATSGLADLNRTNLREIMGYMGSESGIEKVTKGWRISEEAVWKLINDNAIPADWKWVQGMWEIYSDLHGKAREMIERDTGVPLEPIEPRGIENEHGKWTGGYWPVNYDRVRSPIDQVLGTKNPIFDSHYKRAATPHGYTVPRTDFAAPLDISGLLHWSEIQGQIHDIAFREAIRNAAKFVNSPEFMGAFTRAWGPEYAKLLPGWLKDIANVHNYDESYAKGAVHVLNLVRQNTVAALTYLNPGTVYKHGLTAASMSSEQVGTVALAGATRDLGFSGIVQAAKELVNSRYEPPSPEHMAAIKELMHPEKGEAAFEFVMDNSPIMRNRQTRYENTLRGAYEQASRADLIQTAGEIRQFSLMIGRFPVALSDAMSAIPTWLAAYKQAIAEHGNKADAVFEADRKVARAHGSQFIGDKSAIMRMGNTGPEALAKYFTTLFNFWNHAQANVLQLAWDTSATLRGREEPGAGWEALARKYFKYVIIPIVVEETASAALDTDHHSLGQKIAFATMRFFGGMVPGLRDVTNGFLYGNEPSVGMMGTISKEVTKAASDVKKFGLRKTVNKDWLTHLTTALGIATGLGGSQVGKTVGFVTDLATGKDRPPPVSRGLVPFINAYRQGLRTGHSKPRVFK